MAKRHQIFYSVFLKPSDSDCRPSVFNYGKFYSIQKFSTNNKQNNGYDFHLVKLNQQGEEVWEKYFAGKSHQYDDIACKDFKKSNLSWDTLKLKKKDYFVFLIIRKLLLKTKQV
ncbi:hypothetical protein JI747_020225 [Chryseobacterium sp. RG1]|uniref:Uncharacterized protein n=1 Tax=Chryseobacterium tagetis TaxID=2801334 RepID=A0ABS8A689_9FLAO|nr:hypothetical protein [Chryseobacterium tagetis]MCA6069494.1 hypothetical protein [Chryseobacterium tagetis]